MFIAGIDAVEAFFLFAFMAYACIIIVIFVPAFLWAWATGRLGDE